MNRALAVARALAATLVSWVRVDVDVNADIHPDVPNIHPPAIHGGGRR
ncbi:MAG: hypothetical protein KDB56_17390 [Mycobacterium sp.]|nr:hypothetical protein [Mycobacterium sp.]